MGAGIAVFFGLSNALLYFDIEIYPLGPLANVVYTAIVAYAIVKHRLMDIQIIIRKSVIYATLTASITAIYVLIVSLFHGIFGIIQFAHGSLLVNALAAMIVALSFHPLKQRIQIIVDKVFFKNRYDYQNTLKEFSRAISSIVDPDMLFNLIIETITDILYIDKALVMLRDEDGKFNTRFARRVSIDTVSIALDEDNCLIKWLQKNKDIFIREEIEMHLEEVGFNRECMEYFKDLGIAIALPLKSKEDLIGVFALGDKKSQDMYTPEDFRLLETITNQASIAVENANLYEKIRKIEKNMYHQDKLASLGTLASNIAHEIKNPLVSIKTFAQLMPFRFNDTIFIDKFNSIIPKEVERLETILEELLDFSKPKKFKTSLINIEPLIDSILFLVKNEIARNRINIIKRYTEKDYKIEVSPEQIKQVFMNLILNSIHAMHTGGELIISTFKNLEDGNVLEICIKDTGYGIPQEHLKYIFNPFFTTKKDGTGLGLSISKKIVTEHGGNIKVKSFNGEGSEFIVRLPLKLSENLSKKEKSNQKSFNYTQKI